MVGCHVDGGVAPDTVDESGSPRLSARLGRYGATENDAKGREVACGAKAARRRHRDPASNHSPKERRPQQYVNYCMPAEVWICEPEVTQV